MNSKGLFISFEGGEGAGKTTQIKLLADALTEQKHLVKAIREPGGTKVGELIREILLDPANDLMGDRTEALLYAASRAQLIKEVINPLLEEGYIVLADRYIDSTVVYQSIVRGLEREAINQITAFATNGLMPDLTLLLDLPSNAGLARRQAVDKFDRLEQLGEDFHGKVEMGYKELAQLNKDRIVIIEANRTIEEIHQEILNQVNKLIETNRYSPQPTER